MTDIVIELRRWAHATAARPATDVMDDAAVEIERLRALLKRQSEAAHQAVTMLGEYAEQSGFLLGGLEMAAAGHTTAGKVLEVVKAKYRD
jgi:hypothetical protein